jgi:hypothetical protein
MPSFGLSPDTLLLALDLSVLCKCSSQTSRSLLGGRLGLRKGYDCLEVVNDYQKIGNLSTIVIHRNPNIKL